MWKKCCCCFFPREYEPPDVLELDYRHNSLEQVPPDIFTHERTLEKLLLSSNQIKDLPPNLFHCHELRELDLNDNEVKEIPSAIESLTRLQKLNIGRNCLTGVPESIKNCKNLTHLDLSINTLTKLPDVICQLVHLEELFLNETALEFLPANFGRLTKLKTLELRENSLQTLPKSMSRLHQLQKLDIGSNDMEELPEVIGTLTNLNELWVDNNCIHEVPKFIGNLTKLTCLDVSNNNVEEISSEIGKCVSLSDVAFATNLLLRLPDAITKLENAVVIRVNCNRLVELPAEIGKLKNLQELNVMDNELSVLPASIGLLRKLHTLYLDNNVLTELPKEIGSCSSLTVFSAVNNRLREIPSEIGHMANLRMLALTNNSIRHLPVSILNLTDLTALWLTQGQNKPLVALNREIDAETGQHVVTCCLLPQLPPADIPEGEAEREGESEGVQGAEPPRRSTRRIRFEDVVESRPPTPEMPKVAANGGLSRAPTPYPKELRALSKSASQIRANKGQNGDAVNISDEPVYEGDFIEEPKEHNANVMMNQFEFKGVESNVGLRVSHKDRYKDRYVWNNKKEAMKHSHSMPETQQPDDKGDPLRSTSSEANVSMNTVGLPLGSTSSSLAHVPAPSTSSSRTGDDIISPVAPPLPTLSSIGKTPPPYHIAAQRAAFFRSSGGAGTGRVFPTENSGGSATGTTSSSSSSALMTSNSNVTVPDVSEACMNLNAKMNYQSGGENVSAAIQNQNLETAVALSKIVQEPIGIPRSSSDPYQIERRPLPPEPMDCNANPAFPETETVQYSNQEMVDLQAKYEYTELLSDKNANLTSKSKYTLEDDSNANVVPVRGILRRERESVEEEDPDATYANEQSYLEGSFAPHQQQQQPTMEQRNISLTAKTSMTRIPMSYSKRTGEPIQEADDFRLSKIPSAGKGKRVTINAPLSITSVPSPSPSSSSFQEPATHSPSPVTNRERAKIPVRKSAVSMQYEGGRAVQTTGIPVPPSSLQSTGIPVAPSGSRIFNSASRILNYSAVQQSDEKEEAKKKSGVSAGNLKYGNVNWGRNSRGMQQHPPEPAEMMSNVNVPRVSPSGIVCETHIDNRKSSSRIPRFGSGKGSQEDSRYPVPTPPGQEENKGEGGSGPGSSPEKSFSRGVSPRQSRTGIPKPPSAGGSGAAGGHMDPKFAASRKPWIFGSHRNARVVSVEYRKVGMNHLGFTIDDFANQASPEGKGIYVTATDSEDLPIKVGDKILQVDGIDVDADNMGVEIVNKILGNCRENIQLLVSRQQ